VEERAQAKFEDDRAAKRAAAAMIEGGGSSKRGLCRPEQEQEMESRTVSSAMEVKMRGIADEKKEVTVRIYRPNEDVVKVLGKEGSVVQMPALRKTARNWTAVSSAIRRVNTDGEMDVPPRAASTSLDLLTSECESPYDFDGAYVLVHVTEKGSNGLRHAYLIDSDGSDGRFVVLELRGTDAEVLPRAFRARNSSRPVVVLRDVSRQGVDSALGFVHALVTLRSDIVSGGSVGRRGTGWSYLLPQVEALEKMVGEKGEAMDLLGEAVAAFASGRRSTISSYFRSSQSQM